MPQLPVHYMRALRDLTGYWGTYLPTRALKPGMIGRYTDGIFVSETDITSLGNYDLSQLSISENVHEDAVMEWRSDGVKTGSFSPSVETPANVAKISFDITFQNSADVLLLMTGVTHSSYPDTRKLKNIILAMKENGDWDEEYCLINEVMSASSAWAFYATESKQSATLEANITALPTGIPPSLKALIGSADIAGSLACTNFQGFFSALPSGGTPLFSALRFNREWWKLGLGEEKIRAMKGASDAFEEAIFGE